MAFSAMKKIFKPKAAEPSATPSATPYATPSATPYATPSATPSATSSATTLKQFLELTEACNEQAQEMLKPRLYVYRSHRVNYEQCRHLAQKLKLAVERAHLFVLFRMIGEALPPEGLEDVFKLLHALANAVVEVIRSCCQDPWIQAAFLMTNVSEHVLAISFDLELLADFFSGKVLSRTAVDSFYTTEAFIVKSKASQDREALLTDVNTLLQSISLGEGGRLAEYQLADLLLKRLETQRQNLAGSLPEAYRTDMERLKEKGQLGRGSFATVFKAMWLGVEVAKKAFYAPSSPDFAKEVSILGSLSHPNITSLLCYAEGMRECCMVMELMDGDLSQMMRKIMADDKKLTQPFRILEAFDIMLQIGGGMEYLHGKRLVHRDLKAMNILVKHVKGRELELKTVYTFVKVADFGLSKIKERSMTYGNQTLMVGTTRWMAPELIKSNTDQDQVQVSNDAMIAKYPFGSDVYSFGMVCYEILTGEWPYFEVTSANEVKKKVLKGDRPMLPLYCPPGLKDLIERCWSEDASIRPRFDEICAELRLLKYAQILDPYCIPKIVVGLDLGTTFSGFAFAHTSKPQAIFTFYDWPRSMKPYCKTLTALYYEAGDAATAKVKSWGFPALHDCTKDLDNIQKLRAKSVVDLPEIGTYLVRFKHHLASKDAWESSAAYLSNGFIVTQAITDFLQEIGAFIMRNLRTMFGDLTMADVQWCVTVPSHWDDHQKKQMQMCVTRAGLIRSANSPAGSPHPLSIVLEPEAASCYCHRYLPDLELKIGDRLLVADIGGMTTDIVVQEWMSETPDDFRVKEVSYHTGGLCGAMHVDEQFNKFLFATIQCLHQFLRKSTAFMREIFKQWEEIKCGFGDHLVTIDETFYILLPSKLATEWEEFDEEHGHPPRYSYDELELTHADIKAIFDPVVEANLGLIAEQILRTSNVKVIFVVGGFAGSPYLLTKIKERFLGTVEKVISPVQPSSAVSQGAVMLAFDQISYLRRSKFACNADSESSSTSM